MNEVFKLIICYSSINLASIVFEWQFNNWIKVVGTSNSMELNNSSIFGEICQFEYFWHETKRISRRSKNQSNFEAFQESKHFSGVLRIETISQNFKNQNIFSEQNMSRPEKRIPFRRILKPNKLDWHPTMSFAILEEKLNCQKWERSKNPCQEIK